MGGGLGVLVVAMVTKGCVVTCFYSVIFHVTYVAMTIFFICCSSWSIFVHSELIATSLEYICLLSC